jgi:ribosomal protein S18 acetylase RimI-like enzyme
MNVKILQIKKKDYATLLEVAKNTFIETFAHLNNPDDFDKYIQQAFAPDKFYTELGDKSSVFYGVFEGNDLIGYLKLNCDKTPAQIDNPLWDTPLSYKEYGGKMLEIERIYLKKEHHGKGIAQYVMLFIENWAIQKGYKQVWLGVWSENGKAIRFYEKCGFVKIGEHIFYVGNDAQVDWLMLKSY